MNKIVLDEMEGAGIQEIGGPESNLPYSTPPLRFFTPFQPPTPPTLLWGTLNNLIGFTESTLKLVLSDI